MHPKPPLIIPVENQVRELDPKLLLACIAARRGFTSIIGSHREIDFRISQLPRGLYLNKSTYPALLGLEKSRELARAQAQAAQDALAPFDGQEADFLRALADYTVTRAA